MHIHVDDFKAFIHQFHLQKNNLCFLEKSDFYSYAFKVWQRRYVFLLYLSWLHRLLRWVSSSRRSYAEINYNFSLLSGMSYYSLIIIRSSSIYERIFDSPSVYRYDVTFDCLIPCWYSPKVVSSEEAKLRDMVEGYSLKFLSISYAGTFQMKRVKNRYH